jgi:hypoxanthine phosphoribosyltransferase
MIVYSWADFDTDVSQLVAQIRKKGKKYSSIFSLPRGGLPLGVTLSHLLDLPLKFDEPEEHSLVVDDIADSGKTLSPFIDKYDIATLHKHKHCPFVPTYWVREVDQYVVYPWEREK